MYIGDSPFPGCQNNAVNEANNMPDLGLAKSDVHPKQHLDDALEELQNLRFQHATHQLDNPLRIRMVRRDIARLITVLHEIELGIRRPIKQTTE